METYQNYQLYRTNVLLGGQMKYDVVIGATDGNLFVQDFHIRPISSFCPFNAHTQDNLLKYTHQENISRYYKQISGSFYKDFINQSIYPSLDDHEFGYDRTYEMGCSRMSYKLYGKQFEFFCPLWLEHIEEGESVSFIFDVCDSKGNTLFSKGVDLSVNGESPKFHNSFVKYLYDYFKYIGILGSTGNNNVLNILPTGNFASVSGLNVQSGSKQTKIISSLIKNLLSRELPLMEWNNLLISPFGDNKIIANQLFNFNICFNLEDLIPSDFYKALVGGKLRIGMRVKIGNEEISCTDLYHNHEFIPRKKCNPPALKYDGATRTVSILKDDEENAPNVLDYLIDYRNIDYLTKNKLSHNIIHWSLIDNNNYICNAYNGFGGYVMEDEIKYLTNHLYDNTTNIMIREYNRSANSLCWCSALSLEGDGIKTYGNIGNEQNLKFFKHHASKFNLKDGCWVNNIKYKGLRDSNEDVVCSIIIVSVNNHVMVENLPNIDEHHYYTIANNGETFAKIISSSNTTGGIDLIILTNDIKQWTYSKTIGYLSDAEVDEGLIQVLENLIKFLKYNLNLNGLEIIYPQTTVDIMRADSPSLQSNEVVYYKNNLSRGEYTMRYFGKIKPTFIDPYNDINFNYKYRRKSGEEIDLDKFKMFSDSGFPPLYPSLGYYYINREREDYGDPSKSNVLDEGDSVNVESKLFNNSLVKVLRPKFDYTIERNEQMSVDDLNEIISDYKEYYDISCELVDINQNKYKYLIELTLK